ncbi:hypothetical protein, partial [Burkholderia cenocepacia]|uniref:hypothetical protein n=1 Tax=Burkholderia cenocepacia TaxID=95486 RepID=UPI002AC366EA
MVDQIGLPTAVREVAAGKYRGSISPGAGLISEISAARCLDVLPCSYSAGGVIYVGNFRRANAKTPA